MTRSSVCSLGRWYGWLTVLIGLLAAASIMFASIKPVDAASSTPPSQPRMVFAHYMLHAYFRPNGKVLFAPFDPRLSCELPDSATVGGGASSEEAPLLVVALLTLAGVAGASLALRQMSQRDRARLA